MSKGIVESPLHFESYKVDSLSMAMKPHLELLTYKGMLEPSLWDIKIELRVPSYFRAKRVYVGGFELFMHFYASEVKIESRSAENSLLALTASIVGVFRVDDGRLEASSEKKMVKAIIPSVLMPYMRASVSALFATAGFGTVTIPLINMVELSAKTLNDVEILEIE